MVAQSQPPLLTVEEYFSLERESTDRHEYIDGRVYLMVGGAADHGAVATNIIASLHARLRGGPCRVYPSNVRVGVSRERYLYPDVSVTCGERDRGAIESIRSPLVIIEVLSPSTEAYDRGDKFTYYREYESLQEYVLVSTRRAAVEEWAAA
jgi:Uma2 family endonuclease